MKKHKISQRKLGSNLKYSALLSIFQYPQKQKPPMHSHQGFVSGLAVTYSHMGMPHTTIGITAFHFWVRYGVRWAHRTIAANILYDFYLFLFASS